MKCMIKCKKQHKQRHERTGLLPLRKQGADQLCSKCTADQCLGFRYMDSAISLLFIFKITSFQPFAMTVWAGLCQTWWKTPKTGFLALGLTCRWLLNSFLHMNQKLVITDFIMRFEF